MIIIGSIFLVTGALFIFLGVFGLLRMPDVFNKIQAGTKATTLGFVSVVIGLIILRPEWWSKLTVIAVFVLLSNPVASHNLSRAAYGQKEDIVIKGIDSLKKEEEAG
jgi:multicomponent Na+:H+ antiporter subunit G